MNRFLQRFLKFLKWTGIVLGILLVLFIGINAFDETLDPDAAAILNASPKVKPEDNAYFYLAGIYTAESNNPSEVGRKCVLDQLKVAQTGKVVNDTEDIPACREQNALRAAEDSFFACEWRKKLCLQEYYSQRASIEKIAAQNKIVLARYEQLLAFQQFDDTSYLHPFAVTFKFPPSNLYQAKSITRLQAGDTAEFVRRTAEEAAFFRMVLSGESSLLYKMLGIAWLERSARMVSEAIQTTPDFSRKHQAALLEITRPLSLSEQSLGNVMEGELRHSSAMLRSVFVDTASIWERWIYGLAFKQNATANSQYRNVVVWRDLTQLPSEQYLAAEKYALEKIYHPWGNGYLRWIYNPLGKAIIGIGAPAYSNYPRRIIDADGLLRLVSLQIQIAAQKIPESDIPAFLKNADPKFRDPYTGQPMQWDKTRGLYFRGYSDRIADKDGFVSVKL